MTEFDKALDENSPNIGAQLLEKQISGMKCKPIILKTRDVSG